jgi:hypothetical protein
MNEDARCGLSRVLEVAIWSFGSLLALYVASYIILASSDAAIHAAHTIGVSDSALHKVYGPLADLLDRLSRH